MGRREDKDALYAELARVGKAVASGKRVELLELLAQGERTVDALASAAQMTVTNASAHLQVLRQGGLVTSRKDGTRVWYRLADDEVARFVVVLRDLARSRLAEVERAAADYVGQSIDEVEAVSRAELHRRLQAGDVVVIDVRPPEEYAAGHIPGAVSIPVDELEQRLAELPPHVDVVAYCRGPFCVYSPQAVATLRHHGRNARQLEAGFPEWRLADLPVESGSSPTGVG
ncbi:MAG: metalloregulator ArsR/SmtB family transcription factor [Actinomycetota bacterium]|nr:metalloregulator ArsR/SmtB family transcription factor [Actinomycetota bacterium]